VGIFVLKKSENQLNRDVLAELNLLKADLGFISCPYGKIECGFVLKRLRRAKKASPNFPSQMMHRPSEHNMMAEPRVTIARLLMMTEDGFHSTVK
jgi:hypothetical protein